ncbi:choice-of-anchor A family protein [Hyalangium rubrum]|uniref:Choice-of-anchor A family protein n=1 Tax=Hyalangium rubrum TaxID=3103134 RepID=A0ABU5H0S5_9BACT|nr:choice-of-anchor A family protein [Hyalangium sp. s54d21]MDY7226906.1 choice-of-anchor A family protein [Hyalangium sp. s54d21]
MKGQFISCLVFLALSAVACGTPEAGSQAAEAQQLSRGAGLVALSDDSTPPVSSTFSHPNPNPDGTYSGAVSITITATDDASGVESITYTVSGMHTGGATVSGATAYVPILTELGQTTITFYAKDGSGNYEPPQTLVINLTVPPPSCTEISLRDFNLFLTGDYNGGHDVEGKVAVGGNISMENFAVGHRVAEDDLDNVLVAGGQLNISRGAIFGNAYYGDSTTANGTTTFYRGELAQGAPVDFFGRSEELRALSSGLASSRATGTKRVESWGGVFLEGTLPGLNVFHVEASVFARAKYLSITAPANATVVVNVWGESARFSGFGHNFSGGIDQTGVLFNFPDATNITAYGYGFWGTVLAPNAHVDFSDGSWDGGMYAASFTGNAEGHINPLRDFQFCGGGVGT